MESLVAWRKAALERARSRFTERPVKCVSKPDVVEVMFYDESNASKIIAWLGEGARKDRLNIRYKGVPIYPGNYVIKKNIIYTASPQYFEKTYKEMGE